MEETEISPAEGRQALEQVRQRLQGVVKGLGEIERSLMLREEHLPPWPSIQKSSNILLDNLNRLLRTTTDRSDFLRSAHPYPLPNFPARSQNILLDTLLRKKQAPHVEDWIIEGLKHASQFCEVPEEWEIPGVHGKGGKEGEELAMGEGVEQGRTGLEEEDISELWDWAGAAGNLIARDVFKPDEGDEEDGEEEDEEEGEDADADAAAAEATQVEPGTDTQMSDAAPSKEPEPPRLPLSTMLQFMSTGGIPRPVDHAAQQRQMLAQKKFDQEQEARSMAAYRR